MQNKFKFGLKSSGGVSWKCKNGTSFWPCSCSKSIKTILKNSPKKQGQSALYNTRAPLHHVALSCKLSKACDPSLPTIQTWLNRTEWLMASHCAAETFKLHMKKDGRFVSSLAARTVLKCLKTLFHHPLPHRESVERSMQMSNPKTSQRSQDPLTGPSLCNSGLRRLLKFGRKSKTPVWWQPTALTAWYAGHPTALIVLHVGNLQHSKPCTLATCSPHGPVCWHPAALIALYVGHPTARIALYVGHLQHSKPGMLATCSPHGPVCWQPTALKALHVGNRQHPKHCMLATCSPHGPVCWQPTAHTHMFKWLKMFERIYNNSMCNIN